MPQALAALSLHRGVLGAAPGAWPAFGRVGTDWVAPRAPAIATRRCLAGPGFSRWVKVLPPGSGFSPRVRALRAGQGSLRVSGFAPGLSRVPACAGVAVREAR